CSAPATATGSGRAACSICRATVRRSTITNSKGPSSGPISSALISTRRSRRLSRHSLRKTTQAAARLTGTPVSRQLPQRRNPDQLHEGLLEARLPGLLAQGVGGPLGDDATTRDDDHVITQRADFLHDVCGKEHATTIVPQAAQEFAQAARGHDVQAVGGLIEQHV